MGRTLESVTNSCNIMCINIEKVAENLSLQGTALFWPMENKLIYTTGNTSKCYNHAKTMLVVLVTASICNNQN